jgi:hypothetical protein
MAKAKKIHPITDWFIDVYRDLESQGKMISQEELAKLLGYKGKSAVGNILSRGANFPVDQLEKFEKCFGVQYILNTSEPMKDKKGDQQQDKIREINDKILDQLFKQLDWMRDRIDTNLDGVLVGLAAVSARQSVDREVVYSSLSRIEKKEPGALLEEANKIMTESSERISQRDKTQGNGNDNNH